ncbi:MAG: hypothetical protein V2I67_02545 [Thermoanaerobaculales bacterium]|nr:hypothetical protein [Thermoanaerobaculales bacterium]
MSSRPASVSLCWLDRDSPNSTTDCVDGIVIEGGVVRIFPDVVAGEFFMAQATGAIQVRSSTPVGVWARMYSESDQGTFGQGFEGIPTESWWDEGTAGSIPGVISGNDFRTNFFALAGGDGATLRVTFKSGTDAFGSSVFELGPWMPVLKNVANFLNLPVVENAIGQLVVEVVAGRAVFGGSVIDNDSNDPSTLQPIPLDPVVIPSPTLTPTMTPTSTATPTPSPTATPTPSSTPSSTRTPSPTGTKTPTRTWTPTSTWTPAATWTPASTWTPGVTWTPTLTAPPQTPTLTTTPN